MVCVTARRAGFGSKLAWLARPDQPLVLIGRDDEDAQEAAALAAAVGLRDDASYLAGGMTSWREERQPVERVAASICPGASAQSSAAAVKWLCDRVTEVPRSRLERATGPRSRRHRGA